MTNIFKKLNKKQENSEITVIDNGQELENTRKIEVLDLKQYLVNGYNEIREEKAKNRELQEQLENEKKYELLYESTLVTLDEFRKRDDENKDYKETLQRTINLKNKRIKELEENLNDYKIKENELLKRENSIALIKEEVEEQARRNYKEKVLTVIKEIKGNISKAKLVDLIEKIKED